MQFPETLQAIPENWILYPVSCFSDIFRSRLRPELAGNYVGRRCMPGISL